MLKNFNSEQDKREELIPKKIPSGVQIDIRIPFVFFGFLLNLLKLIYDIEERGMNLELSEIDGK